MCKASLHSLPRHSKLRPCCDRELGIDPIVFDRVSTPMRPPPPLLLLLVCFFVCPVAKRAVAGGLYTGRETRFLPERARFFFVANRGWKVTEKNELSVLGLWRRNIYVEWFYTGATIKHGLLRLLGMHAVNSRAVGTWQGLLRYTINSENNPD